MPRQHSLSDSTSPLVVKLGGSLYNKVPDLVSAFLSSERPLFVVPGGGPFADQVRNTKVGQDSAHWMAIAAMEQFGWFISDQGIEKTEFLKVPDRTVVFLPYRIMRELDPLPHSWDVTSDSIAAWVAASMEIELLLLKSVDGIENAGVLQIDITSPVRTDVVDPFFIPFVLDKKIKTTVINGYNIERVRKFLHGQVVPGSCIGTTF